MTKLLQVGENERLDKKDFDFAVRESQIDVARQVVDRFLTSPLKQRSWILDGFAITNPAASQLRVDRGTAILPMRFGHEVKYGVIAAEGDAYRILDLSGYDAGAHGIYIKFDHVESDSEGRLFWSSTGAGIEYGGIMATRLSADWALRVEQVNPGAEWVKIGEVVPPTMTITDQRNFYFEGPAGSYATTWGSGTDRDANRALYGIGDLQTFCDMIRTFIEEVKGGGRRWWENGFLELWLEDTLSVGPDESMKMQSDAATNTLILEDGFANVAIDRSTHEAICTWGGTAAAELLASGRLWLKGSGGVHIGAASFAPPSYGLGIGDGDLNLQVDSGIAYVRFDGATDLIRQERVANKFVWRQNDVDVLEVTGGQLNLLQGFLGGVRVGFVGQPISSVLEVVDADFALGVYATKPGVRFDAADDDGLYYDRTNNRFEFLVGGTEMVELGASGNNPQMWFNSGAVSADNKFLQYDRTGKLLNLLVDNTTVWYSFDMDDAEYPLFSVGESLRLLAGGQQDRIYFQVADGYVEYDSALKKYTVVADANRSMLVLDAGTNTELLLFGHDSEIRMFRDRSVGAEFSKVILSGTESAPVCGLSYSDAAAELSVFVAGVTSFLLSATQLLPPGDGVVDLGAAGNEFKEVFTQGLSSSGKVTGTYGRFDGDASAAPTSTNDVARRNKYNACLCCVLLEYDGTGGTWIEVGNGWNVSAVGGTDSVATVTLDQSGNGQQPVCAVPQNNSLGVTSAILNNDGISIAISPVATNGDRINVIAFGEIIAA